MSTYLLFTGDVYFKEKSLSWDFTNIGVFDYEYVINLECVLCDSKCKPITDKINLKSSMELNNFSKKPLAANLANNHIMDFTDGGFRQTEDQLKKNNIPYFGVGKENNNFHNPLIVEFDNKKIALLGYSAVESFLCSEKTISDVSKANPQKIESDIIRCKNMDIDFVIVSIHWGREERPFFSKQQQELGHFIIDAGADMVIGHHPHCIQPVELYKEKYIFYSLGNFAFDDIAADSYYNELGKSEFVMHKRHLNYGKCSIVPVISFSDKIVLDRIIRTKYHKGIVKAIKTVDYRKVVPKVYQNRLVNEIVGYFRMLRLFVRSNVFVDNRLVNTNAIKKEFEFLKVKRG